MDDLQAREVGHKFIDTLTKEQLELITTVMLSTMDMCNSINVEFGDKPIYFTEDVAYKCFRSEMLGHLLQNEHFDFNEKKWVKD